LKHDGELRPHTFGVDQPDDAVLVGFDSPTNVSPPDVRIVMAASYREANRRAARFAGRPSADTAADVLGAPVRALKDGRRSIHDTLSRSRAQLMPLSRHVEDLRRS
jgi:hypothetical protein